MIGTVSGLWMTAIYIQKMLQIVVYDSQPDDNSKYRATIMTESYIIFVLYLILAVLSWFYFYHHP